MKKETKKRKKPAVEIKDKAGDVRYIKHVKKVHESYNNFDAPEWKIRSATRALVNRANSRLRAFDKADIVNSDYLNIVRTFGNRIKLNKKMGIDEVKTINLAVTQFLNSDYSLASNEKLKRAAMRENYKKTLKELGYNVNNVNVIMDFMGDINFTELMRLGYSSEQIVDMGLKLYDSGITPTIDLIKRGLMRGIDTTLEYYLEDNGVDIKKLNELGVNKTYADYTDIAKRDGVNAAIMAFNEDLENAQRNI